MGGDDENLIRLYEERVKDFDRWEDRKESIKQQSLGQTDDSDNVMAKRFDRAVETSQDHDALLKSVITPFGPKSEIYDETDWKLLGVGPLYEEDPYLRNPDTLIGHNERENLVTVECKSGLESPQKAIKQIRGATEVILENQSDIIAKTGCNFSDIEPVLCVPSNLTQKAVSAIEKEERENDPDQPIYLWTLHRFQKDKLQLHTQFSTRTEEESRHKSQLAGKLGKGSGVVIAGKTGLTPEFFPDSHRFSVMDIVFSEILYERKLSDNSIRKFTRGEVFNYINDQKIVPHYDIEAIAEIITDNLLDKLIDFGLIEEVDPDSGVGGSVDTYGYDENTIRGQSVSRILSNLKSEYESEWAERKAEKEAKQQTAEEFRDENPRLDRF